MKAGRKRSFDTDEALDKAMRKFWANGYSGTSMSDLTAELGINKPSIYSAFGNKEQLFDAALTRYVQNYGMGKLRPIAQYTDESGPTLKDRIKHYLSDLVVLMKLEDSPHGCFFVNSKSESASVAYPDGSIDLLTQITQGKEQELEAFFTEEQSRGALGKDTDIPVLVGYFMSIVFGLAVHARSGSSIEKLHEITKLSVGAFPDQPIYS